MNRHQRRALASKKAPPVAALGKIQDAVHALKGLNGMPEQIAEALQKMEESQAMVSALVDDAQELADRQEALETLVFRLVGKTAAAEFEQELAKARARRGT